ncbi:DUF1441 family protein [Endozoicomonas sp. SM1973]|uniref:DUF1441 family protein n=1 Tax=Spartinivicinus marinus TaxID=2994442 RepID=A0A853IMC2_9GAMM|nr:DUF1441 family protein [Spartinivicinus marinus]NYZ70467.1 DUF1441 family protein [Spartinivicinus marinus]
MNNTKQLNITEIAEFYGLHRDTVRNRLRREGIEPVTKIKNTPLYDIAEVEPLFYESETRNLQPGYDPDELPPKDRKDWYQSENERLKFQQACKELIPAKDVRDTNVVMMKTLVAFFESLPDKMERTRLFTPDQLDLLEQQCDQFRAQLHQKLMTCYD